MRLKNIIRIGIIMIILVMTLPNVFALGITPGRKTIDYEAGKEVSVVVTVLNKEHKEFNTIIYTEGVLKDYIELSDTRLSFKATDEEKGFSYKVKLPEWLKEKPGIHDTKIIVREIGKEENAAEISINSLVAVTHQFRVNVVYPGILANIELIVQSGKPTLFIVPVFSVGEDDIKEAKAVIEIFDLNGNKITTIETNTKGVESKHRRDLLAEFDIVEPGFYYAVATLNYDGKTAQADKVFSFGDFFLNLLDISVKNFKLGEIAKFNILVENIANVEVKNAQAEMFLKDNLGGDVADIRSLAENVAPKQKKELIAFWDTEGVLANTYKGKIALSHDVNRSIEKYLTMKVTSNEIITTIGDITGLVVEEQPQAISDKASIVLLFVIMLVVVNIAWIVYMKKFKK